MKARIAKAIIFGSITTVIIATLLSGTVTFLDWRANPSGIFHDESGTHWKVVFETFGSWFKPTCFLAFTILTIIRFAIGDE